MARRLLLLLMLVALAAIVWSAFAHRHRVEPTLPSAGVSEIAPVSKPFEAAVVRSGATWSDADRFRLSAQISGIVNAGDLPPASSLVFMDPRSGRPLYAHNGDMALVPASTIKIIVAGTALRTLGPNYRFATTVVASAPIRGDTLEGDLWLVGSGDPELSTHDLREAARALAQAGVRTITGSVYVDGSAFGPDGVETSWSSNDLMYGWASPASAVSIDNGAIQFTVTPSGSGGAATVDVLPPGSVERLTGTISTVPAGYDTALRIDPGPAPGEYVLSGQIPAGVPQKFWRSLQDPTPRAARIFRTILGQSQITVLGGDGVRAAPFEPSLLWTHRSRPLADVIKHMAYDSDNHIAEQLLRAVGRAAYGLGTPEHGLLAERVYLERLRADGSSLALVDGSGLSPQNRISAGAIAAVLRALVAGPDANRMIALLPRVAVNGTVRFRPLAPDAMGRVYGKSGYIERATGLAGYVKTRHHGVVIYAMLSNDWTTSLDAVWAAQSRLLGLISRW